MFFLRFTAASFMRQNCECCAVFTGFAVLPPCACDKISLLSNAQRLVLLSLDTLLLMTLRFMWSKRPVNEEEKSIGFILLS